MQQVKLNHDITGLVVGGAQSIALSLSRIVHGNAECLRNRALANEALDTAGRRSFRVDARACRSGRLQLGQGRGSARILSGGRARDPGGNQKGPGDFGMDDVTVRSRGRVAADYNLVAVEIQESAALPFEGIWLSDGAQVDAVRAHLLGAIVTHGSPTIEQVLECRGCIASGH